MKKIMNIIDISLLVMSLLSVWGEFILCFIRRYEELWITILVPAFLISLLSIIARITKNKFLYPISTAITIAGVILLIGFPSYVLYLAIVLSVLSIIAEIAYLVLYIKERKENTYRIL